MNPKQVSYSSLPYYGVRSLTPSNPNSHNFHNFSSDSSFSQLLPTFNPYPNSSSSSSNLPVIEPQTAFYQDSNAASPSWVVKQAAPVKYIPAIQPVNQVSIAASSYDASLNSNWLGLIRNIPKRKIKRPKTIPKKTIPNQNVRCDLCKIECTSIELYEKHLAGKKHSKHLQKIYAPSVVSSTVQVPQSMNNRRASGETSTPGGHSTPGVPSGPTNLETKKQKLLEGGTAAQSLRVCTICNIACNGEIVYADHLAGKKHALQLQVIEGRARSTVTNPNPILTTNPQTNPQNTIQQQQQQAISQITITQKSKNGGFSWCEVCKTTLPASNDDLIIHRQGKKHKNNLTKLQNSITNTTTPTTSTATPLEHTKASNATVVESHETEKKGDQSKEPEDLETKKRKIVESGGEKDAIRTCTVCNVVCNSQLVFNYHLAGQKHAAMVKQAEARTALAANGDQVVNSAT